MYKESRAGSGESVGNQNGTVTKEFVKESFVRAAKQETLCVEFGICNVGVERTLYALQKCAVWITMISLS